MRGVFPLAAGIANLAGVCGGVGDLQRQKGGILSVIIYREPPPHPPPACSVTKRLVCREQRGYSGQCALGRHARVIRINFSYLGFSKVLECSSHHPSLFRAMAREELGKHPWHSSVLAQKWPCHFRHSLLARSSHVAPPCVATLLIVLEGGEDQVLACHSTGPNLVIPHIHLCHLHR